MLLHDASDNFRSYAGRYAGMDGPNKRNRKRTSYVAQCEDTRSKSPSITSSIESSPSDASVALEEESTAAEGESPLISLPDVTDASEEAGGDSKCQITQPLEGGTSEILRSEDAIDVMTLG